MYMYVGKLCDFGFQLSSLRCQSVFTENGFAKSEGYYPPELIYGKYSTKSDVYIFGVVSQWPRPLIDAWLTISALHVCGFISRCCVYTRKHHNEAYERERKDTKLMRLNLVL